MLSGKTYPSKPSSSIRSQFLLNLLGFTVISPARYTPLGGQDLTKPIPYNPTEPVSQPILSSCQQSLGNLGTTYLDSCLLHSPLPTLEQTLEAWKMLAPLQDEGKIPMIDVSNIYDVRVLITLGKARKVQVVQNRWYEGNKKVVRYCKENGIMYQCVLIDPSLRHIE
jgi:aryl-alcohol dehydrogenase-like predicted oxidoreductase